MKRVPGKTAGTDERAFERLTLNERLQHGVLVLSFTTLVITGIPVRYHDSVWAGWLFTLMGGPVGRAMLHRLAAIALVLLSGYHVCYLLFSERGHFEVRALIPRAQDARDAVHHMLYYVGRRPSPPAFGRFSYVEKFEYLAVVWGTAVMAATGALLWFEVQAMMVLPKWVLDICRIVHGYEAVLAALAIIIWHMYCVHLRPGTFPMSRTWLDGRITETEMKHHHPLEYEEIRRQQPQAPPPNGGDGRPRGGAAAEAGLAAPHRAAAEAPASRKEDRR
ncbi:MAG: cytochrome b/b6 domain-containing protein [Armatimonadetes bacterium]|nr:cytochrome b/b6 domain-containing protein [Armatimonadota bacterium]